MQFFYSVFIHFYGFILHFASLFNKKAGKWCAARENLLPDLAKKINADDNYCWIHCASAGEFEQAIPLINRIKSQESGIKTEKNNLQIAVSFFSPSGFEMYKDSDEADLFFYFPLDTKQNATQLIEILKPQFVIFIRNEIWLNVLSELKSNSIPAFLVNVNLEQKRSFFYQKYLDKAYPLFTKIYDTKTFGNTKLEKVIENKDATFSNEILDDFYKDSFVIIAGSSWTKEEEIIAEFYKEYSSKIPNLKIIIAPHEFDKSKINQIQKLFEKNIFSYSDRTSKGNSSILFLDKQGILKYAYRYADIAVIGGGFGKGVHNISEAAVYGIPTIFGTNFHKFEDANDLVKLQLAFAVDSSELLQKKLIDLASDIAFRNDIKEKSAHYFTKQKNSSKIIISNIFSQVSK